MIYPFGATLKCRETGSVFSVLAQTDIHVIYAPPGHEAGGICSYALTEAVPELFEVDVSGCMPAAPAPMRAQSVLDTQEGGDHYKKLGAYQPWEVLRRWLTPEEFRGYMKGTAIAYLAREQDKGGMLDIKKAGHTLQGFIELAGGE